MRNNLMQEVINYAKKALDQDEIPIAAAIIDPKSQNIISIAHNQTIKSKDPLAHAEIIVIRDACKKLNIKRLDDYDIYVTLEPCTMCAAAISTARIKNLYFSACDEKYGSVVSNLKYFEQKNSIHKPNYYFGFKEKVSINLLQEFFAKKR
jgi:tRNA(adenine34) deaminase